jgi:hypothetical protein
MPLDGPIPEIRTALAIASLLCAFEWGIQAKIGPGGEGGEG